MIKKAALKNRLIVTPGSGHGTVAIYHALGGVHACDAEHIFGWNYDVNALPRHEGREPFMQASGGVVLDLEATVAENLLRVIRMKNRRWVLFRGNASLHSPFLTQNRVKAIGIVRHPVDAAAALILERHPEIVMKCGGSSRVDAFRWYGELWCRVTEDLFDSGSDIVKFTDLPDALIGTELYEPIKAVWREPKVGFGFNVLTPEELEVIFNACVPMLEKMEIKPWTW